MSNYPMWWDSTITVFNKHTDSTTNVVSWYKTILYGCFWKNVGSRVQIGETVLDTASICCRIPQDDYYLLPALWRDVPNESKSNNFTLQPQDIIILGEVDEDIDEYTKGKRSTDIIAKYRPQGCMEIKDVTINCMNGMISPHYNVRGL